MTTWNTKAHEYRGRQALSTLSIGLFTKPPTFVKGAKHAAAGPFLKIFTNY